METGRVNYEFTGVEKAKTRGAGEGCLGCIVRLRGCSNYLVAAVRILRIRSLFFEEFNSS